MQVTPHDLCAEDSVRRCSQTSDARKVTAIPVQSILLHPAAAAPNGRQVQFSHPLTRLCFVTAGEILCRLSGQAGVQEILEVFARRTKAPGISQHLTYES